MNALASLTQDESIQQETDSLGGRQLLNSGIYEFNIKLAYFEKSKNGATGVNLTFENPATGAQYRETLWATNRNGENFYKNAEGEKKYLAGFLHAEAIALLTTGKSIGQVGTEEKIVKVYNAETKSEQPTRVAALTEMMGKSIKLGIHKQIVNKTALNQSTGKYEDTNEQKEENCIDKVFHAVSERTTAECRAGVETGEFINEWKARWEGKERNRFKEVKGAGTAGAPKRAAGAATGAAPKSSLFG